MLRGVFLRASNEQSRRRDQGAAARSNSKGPDRRGGVGGRRLAEAFDIVTLAARLAEARRRLIALRTGGAVARDVSEAIEADAAIAIAIMRAANNGEGPSGRTGASARRSSTSRPTGSRRW